MHWNEIFNLLRCKVERILEAFFGQHDLLPFGHNVDLQLTLPYLLGTVPWLLSTPDRIPTKFKLPHGLQSNIEPTLDWPCAAHNFDGNAITTEHNSFSCHLQGFDGTNIQPGTKGRACRFCHWYIYTMYKQQSIKSYKHSRRHLGVLFNNGVCNKMRTFWMSTT